jgi:hypothetical protein
VLILVVDEGTSVWDGCDETVTKPLRYEEYKLVRAAEIFIDHVPTVKSESVRYMARHKQCLNSRPAIGWRCDALSTGRRQADAITLCGGRFLYATGSTTPARNRERFSIKIPTCKTIRPTMHLRSRLYNFDI